MFSILVICTHNSARSILAEGILNRFGADVFRAYSAGSAPRDHQQPNPIGLQVLQERGYDINGFSSKSWDAFTAHDAAPIDLVITVCDSAAGETCPLFIGSPLKVHWGYSDPSAGDGSDTDKLAGFNVLYEALTRRIKTFAVLAKSATDAGSLQACAMAVQSVA
jgi:arsenate reductase (thioredoxin)